MVAHGNHPEVVLRAFFAEALARERAITKTLGSRLSRLFRAIKSRSACMRFSDETSEAAFWIDPVSREFVFFSAGFYALSAAVRELAGPNASAEEIEYFEEIAYASYGLHEIFHPEQGLTAFSIVQDHKNFPQGYDEIGKLDHVADNRAISLIAAVQVARAGKLDRRNYLNSLRDVSYLMNRVAPVAFPVAQDAMHKQKRHLINWLGYARLEDALRSNMVEQIEAKVGPLDVPLWIHINPKTGEFLLWEQEPIHKVLGTARIQPAVLQRALYFRDQMDVGELVMPLRAILRALRVDAEAVRGGSDERSAPTEASS